MAYTKIKPITVTVYKAINYGITDKVEELKIEETIENDPIENSNSNKKDDVLDAISYAQRNKKEELKIIKTISSGLNCTPENAHKVFQAIQDKYISRSNRKNKNLAYHLMQSFDTKFEPQIANEIGRKLAEELFGDHCCVISTHDNTDYTHNHIIINAWNNRTGKKLNDDLALKRKIRKVSDRLCVEYGLNILEETKDMNVIHYTDEKGVHRFYEKTDRKEQLKRDGKYSNNDYRNSDAYIDKEEYKKSNRAVIKEDMDRLLPYSKTYEELLERLSELGYEIKDKTKNGEWRKHISFKAPMQDKFTRDNSILSDDGEAYTREYLVSVIEENLRKLQKESKKDDIDNEPNDLPYYDVDNYIFGKINIDEIDEEYRKKKERNEAYRNVRRSGIEVEIIRDTKKLNKEIDVEVRMIGRIPREKIDHTEKDKYTQYLINRINGNLSTLKFVEQKNIQSFKEINDVVKMLYEKRNMSRNNLNRIADMMKKLNENLVLIEKYNRLVKQVEIKKTETDVNEIESQDYEELLSKYEKILQQRGLNSKEKQEEFKLKVFEFKEKFEVMGSELEKINEQLKEYDKCVYNLKIVDRYNQKYTDEFSDYDEIKSENSYKNKNRNDNKER